MLDRAYFERLDAEDPLAPTVARFRLPEGVVYLDGNSLGPLPAHVPDVVADVVERQWGEGLVTSWNRHAWWTLASRVGDKLAPVIGAPLGTVSVGDSTTIALYKAVGAALGLRPERSVILTDSGNFPTDLYALGSLARTVGTELVVAEPEEVAARIDSTIAVLSLTHVDYRTGRRHDMAALTESAQAAGAVVVWDLCHSAGALRLDLTAADFAVGCGYKYLNGGPGAPAYLYVHPQHQGIIQNPISGWWAHARPFAMEQDFTPAAGRERMQVGTQPILSLAAFDAALDVFSGIATAALEEKARRLTSDFIRLVDERLEGFEVITPRRAGERGSHVSLAHPEASAIMAALVSAGVIGDVRPPNLLRFGFAPAFQRHVDVWEAVDVIETVMDEGQWREAEVPAGPVT
jgi:kynureninase